MRSLSLTPKADALVVAIVELGEVAFQVLLADVVIGANDPAFQDGEITFNRVGVPEPPRTYSSMP